jgi:hypothetical protein
MNAIMATGKCWQNPYQWKALDKGYSDQSLYVNLDTFSIEVRPVDPEVKERFVEEKDTGSECYGMQ